MAGRVVGQVVGWGGGTVVGVIKISRALPSLQPHLLATTGDTDWDLVLYILVMIQIGLVFHTLATCTHYREIIT